MMEGWDFTLDKYSALCDAIATSDYVVMLLKDFIQAKDVPAKVIIMRHDVDDHIRFVDPMARVEHDHGIRSTYYFRMRDSVFVPDLIDRAAVLGHDIGYHYETLDKAHGDLNEAVQIFSRELAQFRERYDVRTVCMHGNPLSPYDNKDIWKVVTPGSFSLIGEPYISLDYNRFAYFSDSGRSWSDINKVKDRVSSIRGDDGVSTTDELIRAIRDERYPNMSILAHPSRWRGTFMDYLDEYVHDSLVNVAKRWVLAHGSIRGWFS